MGLCHEMLMWESEVVDFIIKPYRKNNAMHIP